ncbi:MAG TPA: GNAT family N-acetyltransferase [Nocardioides sp.]|nr:GNAT family N-acetyltransferase [Nocardioides sp.]
MALTLSPLPADEYASWREGAIERRAQGRAVLLAGDVALARERVRRDTDPVLATDGPVGRNEVLVVADGLQRRGAFALMWQSDTRAYVLDLVVRDLADTAAARALVEQRVAAAGGRSLGIRLVPGDRVAAAFVADAPFHLVSTQMVLDLAVPGPDQQPERIRARPMTEDELSRYFDTAAEEFADETMRADPLRSREDAVQSSRRMYDAILPEGLATAGHEFLVAVAADDGRRIGMLWLLHEERSGFVYDVVVDDEERGRGYGRALMDLAAAHCRGRGLRVLALNVFAHNHVARALYDALGYVVVDDTVQEPVG